MDALVTEGLPPGWAATTLGELAGGPRARVSADPTSDLPFVGLEHIAPNALQPNGFGRFGDMRSAASPFSQGDVLYARMRPYLNKVWRADREGVASAEFLVFPRSERVRPDFLALLLHHRSFVEYARHASSGDRPRVEWSDIASYPISLPPFAEQTRIVAAVNALFEEVEAGEAALARAREGLTRFRASLLHAAYSGELTAAWRSVRAPNSSGTDLVASILAARQANGWKGDVPGTREAAPLPPGWVWSSLGELFDVFVGATPARGVAEFWGGDVPWVSSGEVAFCTIQRTRETITQAGLARTSTKLHPPGTVLLAMIGEGRTRGQAAILGVAACNSQNSAAIRVADTPIPPRFIYHWLALVYQETRRAGAGGNQPALNKERVRSIALPVPPLLEMEEIVSRLDSLLGEAALVDLDDEAARLRQSILHAAFTGRLVPQDPADEPAATLLARLRAAPTTTRRPRQRRATAQPDLIETPA